MDNKLTPDEVKCATRCSQLWEEAVITYQLPEDIRFVLRFRTKLQSFKANKKARSHHAVGTAHYDRELKTATVTLNRDAIAQNPQDMLEDTVPHEVAHIVCMIKPHLGDGHNQGWQTVCKRLGGSGNHRYAYGDYDMRLRKRRQYVYNVPDFGRVHIGDVRHRAMQDKGIVYKSTKGYRITKENWTGEVV